MVNTIESDCDQGTNEQYELVFTVAQALAAPVRKYELLDLNGVSDLDGFTVEREVQLRKKLSNLDGEQLHNLHDVYINLAPIHQVIVQRLATNFGELLPINTLYPGYTEDIHTPAQGYVAIYRIRPHIRRAGLDIYQHTNYWNIDKMPDYHNKGGKLEYVLAKAPLPEWWFPWPDGTNILANVAPELTALTNYLCEVHLGKNTKLTPRFTYKSAAYGAGVGTWLLYKKLASSYPEPLTNNTFLEISRGLSGNNFHVFKSQCIAHLRVLLNSHGLFRLHVNRKLGLIYLTKQ